MESHDNGREFNPELQEQDGLREPLLQDCDQNTGQTGGDNRKRKLTRLWRIRSAPEGDIPDLNNLEAQAKQLVSASFPYPPRLPQFEEKRGGLSKLLKAVMGIVLYLLLGVLGFSLLGVEGSSTSTVVDIFYFSIVTMTTVGYGDIVPKSVGAKLFTCLFVFTGFGLVGELLSGAANYLVEKQEEIFTKKFRFKYKEKGNNEVFIDDNEVVSARRKAAVSGGAVVILFIVGVLALIHWEGMNFTNALYCVCVTVTTLGYGDHSFRTESGRMFAIVWIVSSTVCVGQFFFYLAESRTVELQHQLAIWALSRPTTRSDLLAADLDGDGVVSAAEFVIYKLKEIGKIDEDDVADLLKEFCFLDADQSGTLNLSDIRLSSLEREQARKQAEAT